MRLLAALGGLIGIPHAALATKTLASLVVQSRYTAATFSNASSRCTRDAVSGRASHRAKSSSVFRCAERDDITFKILLFPKSIAYRINSNDL